MLRFSVYVYYIMQPLFCSSRLCRVIKVIYVFLCLLQPPIFRHNFICSDRRKFENPSKSSAVLGVQTVTQSVSVTAVCHVRPADFRVTDSRFFESSSSSFSFFVTNVRNHYIIYIQQLIKVKVSKQTVVVRARLILEKS